MRDYERLCMAAVLENLSASIASDVRETVDAARLVEDERRLAETGRMYVLGFLVGRLSLLRAGVEGNPNLSTADVEELAALVEDREAAVVAELYA